MRVLMVGVLLSVVGLSAGCISAPPYAVPPAVGLFYTDVAYPQNHEATPWHAPGSKRGEGKATSFLGLVTMGDASIEGACKSAGITTLSSVDFHQRSILLGIYSEFTTIVTGQ